MKKVVYVAIAAMLLGAPGSLLAQAKPAAASGPLSQDQKDHAVQDFGVLSSAMRSEQVPEDVKAALMGCIYSNTLGQISTAIDKVSADNPGKVDRKSPDSVLGAMAAICGYKPSQTSAAPPPGGTAPKATKGATTGR